MKVTDLFAPQEDEITLALSRISGEESSPETVVLNREHLLNLTDGSRLLHSFVCSPSNLGELCVGWIVTQGYCARSVEVSCDGHSATAQGVPPLPAEPEPRCPAPPAQVTTSDMLALFHQVSDKYARSHGIHECVIKGDGWHILRTDIGRHNAIDKAVGAAVLAGYDLNGAALFSSGRINVETVKKAARCGIGCLMSKAVITHEALSLAQALGLTVLFSVKEGSHIV